MRFDAEEYLETWQTSGKFPKIHDAIMSAIIEHAVPGPICDVGSSTGLLSQQIKKRLKVPVLSVEGHEPSILKGRSYNAYDDQSILEKLWITNKTLNTFIDLLNKHGVRTLVARRCLYEIGKKTALHTLFQRVANTSVEVFIIQGGALSRNIVHPWLDVDVVVDTVTTKWRLIASPTKQVRVLQKST
jgi:hypothetical protein